MDITNQITIPAATETTAGAMTAADRIKMTKLFDGTMLDAQNPAGYHRHNYLEMADLPPIVSLSAANYQEFKNAAAKLQPEIAAGKFGEIVQTGDWVINDDTLSDITGITLVRQKGIVWVNQKPLKLLTQASMINLSDLYFQGGNYSQHRDDVKSLYIKTTVSADLFFNNLMFFYANGTHIEIDNGTLAANIYIDKIRNSVGGGFSIAPLTIKYTKSVDPNILCTNLINSGNNKINVIASSNRGIELNSDCTCEFINLLPTTKVSTMQTLFTASNPAGLAPAPTAAQKTPYHFLNAKGEWVDIRTIVGA